MNNFKLLIKRNKLFFTAYILFLLTGTLIILFFTKARGFYLLNPLHHPLLNYLFYFFTFLGDGFFIVCLAIIFLLFKRRKLSLLTISSYALSGIVAQALKYYVVEARPAVYPGLAGYDNFIHDVTLHNYHAFPSGHTASAFALASVLTFSFKNKSLGVVLLLIAVVVGYSRIYIGQHFLIDVLAGSFIGVVSGIICWLSLYKRIWLM